MLLGELFFFLLSFAESYLTLLVSSVISGLLVVVVVVVLHMHKASVDY